MTFILHISKVPLWSDLTCCLKPLSQQHLIKLSPTVVKKTKLETGPGAKQNVLAVGNEQCQWVMWSLLARSVVIRRGSARLCSVTCNRPAGPATCVLQRRRFHIINHGDKTLWLGFTEAELRCNRGQDDRVTVPVRDPLKKIQSVLLYIYTCGGDDSPCLHEVRWWALKIGCTSLLRVAKQLLLKLEKCEWTSSTIHLSFLGESQFLS